MAFRDPTPYEEISERRLAIFTIVATLLFVVLVGRLWQLQIVRGAYYLQQSEENRLRDLRIVAPRGILFDRKGRPMVTSRAAFTVSVFPMELRDPDHVLPRLAAILNMSETEIRRRIDESRKRPFEPVRLRRDAPTAIVAMVEENRLDLPGVIIEVDAVRHYLHGKLAAHALGYVGEISEPDLATPAWKGYRMGDIIGKSGIERVYDRQLRGTDGRLRVEVDARGRPLRVLTREQSSAGKSMVLTIDLEVQKTAEAALGNRRGAVVVMDPRNGEVLAIASHPAFNPNAFAGGISPREWIYLSRDRSHPLLNRATDSSYEPGSVFKIVTAAAALTQGKATRATRVFCNGSFHLGSWVFGDLIAHGNVDFISGVARSCNVFFYTLGVKTGGEGLSEMANALGLGETTGIDLPSETAGLIPSPKWKEQVLKDEWRAGDSANMSIGQGAVNVTALQVARMMAAIGNNGTIVRPHLVREVIEPDGRRKRMSVPPVRHLRFDAESLRTLQDALTAVVARGTGGGARIHGLTMAGKTGSAENPRGKPHAWFAAYAPTEAPAVAVAVVIEHGFRGGLVAAPIARAVIQAAFGMKPNIPAEDLADEPREGDPGRAGAPGPAAPGAPIRRGGGEGGR